MRPRALLLLFTVALAPATATAQSARDGKSDAKERVTGIGGLFFRARDPQTLSRWYLTHLGVTPVPASYDESPWRQEAGPTVFTPFPDTTGYFGRPEQAWMVNFRVRNLAAMAAQLTAAGIAVKIDPKEYPNGRFARLHDPEGNPIELWEPRQPGAAR
jgi:glyoxylase I family protein